MRNLCFEVTKELNQYQIEYQLDQLIEVIEDHLRLMPVTGFQKIIGRDLMHLSSKIKGYIYDFYDLANQFYRMTNNPGSILKLLTEKIQPEHIKAIHCEMNDFTQSNDTWFIDLFSYSSPVTTGNLDWFDNFDFFSLHSLAITGFEDLQEIYRNYNYNHQRKTSQQLEMACKFCDILIMLRLQQVIIRVTETSKLISKIPIFVTFYNSDMVLKNKAKHANSLLIYNHVDNGGYFLEPGRHSYFEQTQLQG